MEYKNELEGKLTFAQQLQLRIAKERGIKIEHLRGEEFSTIKKYVQLEERKDQMNNVSDFFDEQYQAVSQPGIALQGLCGGSAHVASNDQFAVG